MSKRKYTEKIVSDGAKVLRQHLSKSRKILDELAKSSDVKTLEKQLKELQKAVDAHNVLIDDINVYKQDYARSMLDLCKHREINVGATQKKLKTVPWTIGKEKYDEEQEKIRKKLEKKLKKKKL